MKKTAQRFSFIMMIISCLTGIAMTIVMAATVGSVSYDGEKWVFPIILIGFVGTLSMTSVWAAVLEHFKNVEKSADSLYRSKTGKEELPDSAYSYVPVFIRNIGQAAAMQQYQQPYQYGQQPPAAPTAPDAPTAPVQQAASGWNCPKCGVSNSADSKFCAGCGRPKN